MRTRIPSLLLPAVLAAIASLVLVAGALGAEVGFSADLSNGGEGDEDGSGTAAITIDPDTGEVCYDLTVDGIQPVTASHIHIGAEGESGDVVVPLDVDGFEGSSSDCVDASDADLDAIIANPAGYYVNIHTEDFPAGAIRGQLVADSPDTAMETPTSSPWAALGLLLVGMAGVLGVRVARRRA
ncbi:MAG TPA: CHRD domain-containing protein [Candidatus Limnocylindria bacterium]|nr:CHRD domain-containing protein [Candidatus Limnocylindria bacterium]